MTAVIGILSKEGVALSADSAVTRSRHEDTTKVTSNGNKMVRLVENTYATIGVMVTGNGDYMLTPWDIIIRRFRMENPLFRPRTVDESAACFLEYVKRHNIFCDSDACGTFIKSSTKLIYYRAYHEFRKDNKSVKGYILDETGKNQLKVDKNILPDDQRNLLFKKYKVLIIETLGEIAGENLEFDAELAALKEEFVELVFFAVISQRDTVRDYSELIFSGFGADEKYPSLCSVYIYGGLPNWINYSWGAGVRISDANPVAICPFAQTDISNAVLQGFKMKWYSDFKSSYQDKIKKLFSNWKVILSERCVSAQTTMGVVEKILNEPVKCFRETGKDSLGYWEDLVRHSSLSGMANLARHLIELTWFNKVLTFKVEDVGGELDIATISSKDRKFEWIQRKSWYHHKDIDGRYGKNGV